MDRERREMMVVALAKRRRRILRKSRRKPNRLSQAGFAGKASELAQKAAVRVESIANNAAEKVKKAVIGI